MKLSTKLIINPFCKLSKATTTRPTQSDESQAKQAASALSSENETGPPKLTEGEQTCTIRLGQGNRSLSTSSKSAGDPNIGLKVLIDQPADRQGSVDIVALHGLNGHRDLTWTDRETGLNWLSNENCLPEEIPNARILTFGYNSKTYFSRAKSDIQDFASELLVAINTRRLSHVEKRRPLIFLCHSLGGLVFKQVGRSSPVWNLQQLRFDCRLLSAPTNKTAFTLRS